jgi:hypothetical protein
MALRNGGFGSAEIEEYAIAELKKAPSGIQRMPTAQTLIDYRLCASVGIASEKRRSRRESRSAGKSSDSSRHADFRVAIGRRTCNMQNIGCICTSMIGLLPLQIAKIW